MYGRHYKEREGEITSFSEEIIFSVFLSFLEALLTLSDYRCVTMDFSCCIKDKEREKCATIAVYFWDSCIMLATIAAFIREGIERIFSELELEEDSSVYLLSTLKEFIDSKKTPSVSVSCDWGGRLCEHAELHKCTALFHNNVSEEVNSYCSP